MHYREDTVSGNRLSILGLGCMRFPSSRDETERLILRAIEGGVNYFDTAYLYPNNEETLGRILGKHKKRGGVFIATKLPLTMCKGRGDFDKFFDRQLARLQTDYIDYYLMHMITDTAQWDRFRAWGIEDWIAEKKRRGQIRQAGFSFHGSQGEFLKVLEAEPWDFCQIQYNYSDETYQAGKVGLKAAGAKGIPVIIMEPLLGGRLASGLPREAVKVFERADPALSPAAWALRWLWNQAEVTCVLSGMTSAAQVEENLRTAGNFQPLQEQDAGVYREVVSILNRAYKIHCTGCNYCMPCPRGINIPGCFAAYNTSFAQNFVTGMQQFVTSTAGTSRNPHSPRLCIECGACESHCPQHLPIRRALKQVARRMESFPLRIALAVLRWFFEHGR